MNTPNIYTHHSTLSRLAAPKRSDGGSDAPRDLSSRLLPLCDGRPGLRGTMSVEVREPVPSPGGPGGEGQGDGGTAVLDFVSSDETLDRYSEIISASGWKLDSYQRNPVFQNAHQYGDVIFTLGRALITELRYSPHGSSLSAGGEGRGEVASSPRHSTLGTPYLFQRIQFATNVNPMARIAHGLYRGKFLSAVSVGFIPLRWENADGTEHQVGRSVPTAPSHPLPSDGRGAGGEGCLPLDTRHSTPSGFRRRYLEQELLEVSAVAIPANPNALALGLKSGAVQKSDLRDLADLLRLTLDDSTAPAPSLSPRERAGVRGNRPSRPSLLSFTRQLHQILKHT